MTRPTEKSTLEEACRYAEIKLPVSERDLRWTFRMLAAVDVKHNLVGTPIWRQLMTDEGPI